MMMTTQMKNFAFALMLVSGLAKVSAVDVVIAHHSEDLSWLAAVPKDVHLHIYTKGPQDQLNMPTFPSVFVKRLPNVGRESQTYLKHIVDNYDRLANWTVFTQAGEPSFGYKGHRSGGGHLMAGDSFASYLTPDPRGSRFIYTSVVHLPSLHHLLRAAYVLDDELLEGHEASTCPEEASKWTSWVDVGDFVKYVWAKVESQHGESIMNFYRKYINPSYADDDVIAFFPQGARFAVSREMIQRRPRVEYERLLATLSNDVDSYAGYYMEWLWSELLVGHQLPCAVPAKTSVITHFNAMQDLSKRFAKSVERQSVKHGRLLAGGVSGGVSGGISGGISGSIEDAPSTDAATQGPATNAPTQGPTTAGNTDTTTQPPAEKTVMDMQFQAADVSAVKDDYVETFLAEAMAELAAKTGVAASAIKGTVVPSVTTSMTFAEDVSKPQAKTIVAVAVGVPEDKVTVTDKARRRLLGNSRRLASEYTVKIEVADTAQAKKVAADVADTAKLKSAAADQGLTISAPTVSTPALEMDVQFDVDEAVSAPSTEELADLGDAVGATATVKNMVVQTTTTAVPEIEDPASSAEQLKIMSAFSLGVMALIAYEL